MDMIIDLGNISLSFLAPRFKKSLLPKFQRAAQPKGWISFQKSEAFYSQVKIFTGHLISARFKLQLCKEPNKGGGLDTDFMVRARNTRGLVPGADTQAEFR